MDDCRFLLRPTGTLAPYRVLPSPKSGAKLLDKAVEAYHAALESFDLVRIWGRAMPGVLRFVNAWRASWRLWDERSRRKRPGIHAVLRKGGQIALASRWQKGTG